MSGSTSPSEIRFGALLMYSPRGTSSVSVESRKFRDKVKGDLDSFIDKACKFLGDKFRELGFSEFFGEDIGLIPVPRSAPLPSKDALWPSWRICRALVLNRLGVEILSCLIRKTQVQKSAYARRGERPSFDDHRNSMAVESSIVPPPRMLLLVDDFVTKGTTFLTAASLVKEAFPNSEVRAFALMRTMGLIPNVEKIFDPCVGRIWMEEGKVRREP